MDDIGRPDPVPSLLERSRAAIEFVGVGRLLAVAASVAAVAIGGWWLLHAPPTPIEQQLPLAGAASTVAGTDPAAPPPVSVVATAPAAVVVQAAGAVVHPGVYTLPAGSRIQDLISAAGGAVPGADPHALPLATVLVDGQRVQVPMQGEAVVLDPLGATGAPAGGVTGPVDLNRATAAQLDELPGVGPSTAAAIVEHRTANGPFASVDDLLDVRGIGPAKLEALRSSVTV